MKQMSIRIVATVLVFAALVVLVLSLRINVPDTNAPVTAAATVDTANAVPSEMEEHVALRVVGSGQYFEEVLPRTLHASPGTDFELLALGSDREVWDLVEDNQVHADVIEVGFRLEALSGTADDRLLAVDPALIPSLAAVDPALRFEVNGLAPAIHGALGHFTTTGEAPSDWNSLVEAANHGPTVVIPGPPLSIAVVLSGISVGATPKRDWNDMARSSKPAPPLRGTAPS